MPLKIHGDYKIEISGEIIIVRLYNAWNEECSKAFLNDYKNIIVEERFKQFGVLADLKNLEGATPDAIKLFKSITAWTFEHGQIARAIVCNSDLKKYIIELALKDNLFQTKAFDEETTAMRWLKQKGLMHAEP